MTIATRATAPAGGIYLDAAEQIGRQIVREAVWFGDRCNWIGAEPEDPNQRDGPIILMYRALGPDLYGGTAGIGLFLAELARQTGDAETRRAALGALRHALSQSDNVPPSHRLGLFNGWTGIALAAVRSGQALQDSETAGRGADLARRNSIVDSCAEKREYDIIAGDAGTIVGLLALDRMMDHPGTLDAAVRLADDLLRRANRGEGGWSWRGPSLRYVHDLTGFSHGAAGVGYALLELHDATGERRFAEAADRAFDYERSWFDPRARNWPDFRSLEEGESPTSYSVFWCHGAPGIALSRARAWARRQDARCREEAHHALSTTAASARAALRAGYGSFSLCHGLAGNAEALQIGGGALGDATLTALACEVAAAGCERYARDPAEWPCGIGDGYSPNLMLGIAGIGHFYLRLHDPTTPGLLLIRPEEFGGALVAA